MIHTARLDNFSRCGIGETSLAAAEKHCRMHCRDNCAAAGPKHAVRFRKEALEIADVFANESAYDEIE